MVLTFLFTVGHCFDKEIDLILYFSVANTYLVTACTGVIFRENFK